MIAPVVEIPCRFPWPVKTPSRVAGWRAIASSQANAASGRAGKARRGARKEETLQGISPFNWSPAEGRRTTTNGVSPS